MSVQLPIRNQYSAKDQAKADRATKFIGRGSPASSTNAYRIAFGELANCGEYLEGDRVFISAEGNRRGRLTFDKSEVDLAIRAGAGFITDKKSDRQRAYNIGEREVVAYLLANNYEEVCPGFWRPIREDENKR